MSDDVIEVSATDVQSRWGYYRTLAHRTPVVTTNHGNPDLVIMAAAAWQEMVEELERLKGLQTKSLRPWELPADAVAGLQDNTQIPERLRQYDDELE